MYYAMQDRKIVSPPVNMLVANYLGYKPEPRKKTEEKGEENDLQGLIDLFGGGGVI